MKHSIATKLLLLISPLLIQSCGSLADWKREIAQDSLFGAPAQTSARPQAQVAAPQYSRPAWNPQALRVNTGALAAAKDRWPWANGYQLQRRAQILQLGPDYSALKNLDTSSDTASEIQILRSLLERRQEFASSSY